MTVKQNDPFNQYSASSNQTVFAYNFEIQADTDLDVYKTPAGDDPNDSAQLLTITTDYTVSGVGNENGGDVTLTSGANANDIITIIRNTPIKRTSGFTASGTLKAANLNTEYDNQILIEQELHYLINNRMLKYQDTAELQSRDLTLPVLGNNQIWQMDTDSGEIQAVDFDADTSASALKSKLTSHDTGEGAELVGLEDQTGVSDKTVQDFSEADFIVKSDTSTTPNAVALSSKATGFFQVTNGSGASQTRTLQGTSNQITVTNSDGSGGNPTFAITDNPVIPGSAKIRIPNGTTAERPGSPVKADYRYNTDNDEWEYYNGSSWDKLVHDGAIGANGIVVRTSANAFSSRSLQGTTNQLEWTNADGTGGDPTINIVDNPVIPGTEGVTPPQGTTAERPSSPNDGEYRWNSSNGKLEYYNGSSWVNIGVSNDGVEFIAGATASSDANVQFDQISSTFDLYMIHLFDVIPASDGVNFTMRFQTGGSGIKSGSSDYEYGGNNLVMNSGSESIINSGGNNLINIGSNVGNSTNETIDGKIWIYNANTSNFVKGSSDCVVIDSNGNHVSAMRRFGTTFTGPITAVRLLFSSGDISSGEFKLYGVVKS